MTTAQPDIQKSKVGSRGFAMCSAFCSPSEPYRFNESHVAEVKAWLPQARVQLVDGEMLSWYGSRSVEGLAYLAALSDLASRDSSPE